MGAIWWCLQGGSWCLPPPLVSVFGMAGRGAAFVWGVYWWLCGWSAAEWRSLEFVPQVVRQ